MDLYMFILYIIGIAITLIISCGIISIIDNIITKKQWRNQYYNKAYVYPLIDGARQHAYSLGITDELKEMVDWFETQLLKNK